jgi:hypothetical protein
MKRKDATESPVQAKRHPRQDPVSCQFCRKKKLKCDRQQPCSSCLTRRLQCSFRTNPPVHHENAAKPARPARPAWSQPPENPQKDIPGPAHPGPGLVGSKESLATADWLEHIHMGDRVPAAVSPQLRAELNEKRHGYDEISGAAHVLLSITTQSWAPNQNPATVDLIQFLPAESDALALFSYFCRYISYLYHIIIPHVVEGQINEVYRCVESRAPVNRSYLALVFAITGSSLFLQCSIQSSRHAAMCSQRFSFLTGAALTQADYRSYPTVEGLQAALIIFHNISHIHCCTAVSGFFTIGSIIDQAKAMLLHRVDTQSAEWRKENTIMLETKRRLWWDIASFDWYVRSIEHVYPTISNLSGV